MNVFATRRGRPHDPSMLEDVEAQRPTEVEMITGSLVREGAGSGCRSRCTRDHVRLDQGEGGDLGMKVCIVGCGAVGSLFAANLGDARRRRGVGLRPHGGRTSTRSTATACGSRAPARSSGGCGRPPTPPSCPRATSGSSRRRRCTRRPRSRATAHAFADGGVATVQNGIGNEEVLARHVERVIRGTTFPAGKLTAPGVVQWDIKGDTTFGPFEAEAGAARGGRAARGGVHAGRHADGGGRRRARAAVAEGDLQRGDEPARRADRPHARPRLRAAGAARGSPRSSSPRERPSPRPRGSSSTRTRRS